MGTAGPSDDQISVKVGPFGKGVLHLLVWALGGALAAPAPG